MVSVATAVCSIARRRVRLAELFDLGEIEG
jgi:hypothetical protein